MLFNKTTIPSLTEAEAYRRNNPNAVDGMLIRVASSLHSYRGCFPFAKPEDAKSLMNERFFDSIEKVFPELAGLKRDEFVDRLDRLCKELEPEDGFNADVFALYEKALKECSPEQLKELSTNQSSSLAILQRQAASQGMEEGAFFLAYKLYRLVNNVKGILNYVLGLVLFFVVMLPLGDGNVFDVFVQNQIRSISPTSLVDAIKTSWGLVRLALIFGFLWFQVHFHDYLGKVTSAFIWEKVRDFYSATSSQPNEQD